MQKKVASSEIMIGNVVEKTFQEVRRGDIWCDQVPVYQQTSRVLEDSNHRLEPTECTASRILVYTILVMKFGKIDDLCSFTRVENYPVNVVAIAYRSEAPKPPEFKGRDNIRAQLSGSFLYLYGLTPVQCAIASEIHL